MRASGARDISKRGSKPIGTILNFSFEKETVSKEKLQFDFFEAFRILRKLSAG
jgi:hypothetical protein